MYQSNPVPVKKIFLWGFVVILGLVFSFIIFASIISIMVGLSNLNQDGFIIPVLAGVFSIALCVFVFVCLVRFIISVLRERDIIRSS
ncbi:MAG: hypothetical protein JW944_14335 [Deltaproteobacteria bacterium]|nr:hypothetical protein [Deltaproteobacteria bacterium]